MTKRKPLTRKKSAQPRNDLPKPVVEHPMKFDPLDLAVAKRLVEKEQREPTKKRARFSRRRTAVQIKTDEQIRKAKRIAELKKKWKKFKANRKSYMKRMGWSLKRYAPPHLSAKALGLK